MDRATIYLTLFWMLCTADSLLAQRDDGLAMLNYIDPNEYGGLVQGGEGSPDLVWHYKPNMGVYAETTFGLPFDVAGDIVRDPGLPARFWVSGRNSTSGHGFIVSLLLDFGSHTVVEEWRKNLGGHDPIEMAYNSVDNGLYYLDYDSRAIFFGAGTTPTSFGLAADQVVCPALGVDGVEDFGRLDAPGAPLSGVTLTWEAEASWILQAGEWRIYPQPFGPWQTVRTDVIGTTPQYRWLFSYRKPLGHKGAMEVMGPAGAFSLVNNSTGLPIWSGSQSQVWSWEEHSVPAGIIQPGEAYRVEGAANQAETSSQAVVASYRFGAPVTQGNWSFSPVGFNYAELVDIEEDFRVCSQMRWIDPQSSMPTGVAAAAMNLAVLEPGVDPTVTVSGLTVLADPLVSFSNKVWAPDQNLRIASYVQGMDLAGTAGITLLFQFVCIAPSGELLVSDIGGGTVSGSAAARSFAPAAGTDAERVREWGARQPGANSPAAIELRRVFYRRLMRER